MGLLFNKNNDKKFTFLQNLKNIYGIGIARSKRFYKILGLNLRINSLLVTTRHYRSINFILNKLVIDEKLKKYLKNINKFSFEIRSYKGIRNKFGLPSRGQQTRTNAKTKKKFKY